MIIVYEQNMLIDDERIIPQKDLIPKTKPCSKGCKTPHWSFNLQNGNAFENYGNSSLTLSHTYDSPWKHV